MPVTILDGTKKIDFSGMKFSAIKPMTKGKVVNVKMNGEPIRIKTPKKMLHWGANDYEGNGKFKLVLQLPSAGDKTPETNTFQENMQGLYDTILKEALANSKDWFGKQLKEEAVRDDKLDQFQKITTSKTGEKNEPVIRVSFNKIKGQYTCQIYDEEKIEIKGKMRNKPLWIPDDADSYPDQTPMQYFTKGGRATTIIEVGGISLVQGKAYIGLNIYQSVRFPNPNAEKSDGCEIDDDEDEPPTTVFKKNEIDTAVESSDDEEEVEVEVEEEEEVEVEEEEEEEPEPEPEPAPKPVKKKVIKKKA